MGVYVGVDVTVGSTVGSTGGGTVGSSVGSTVGGKGGPGTGVSVGVAVGTKGPQPSQWQAMRAQSLSADRATAPAATSASVPPRCSSITLRA